ncbi:MAG: hypothetical protein HQL27_07755, partial [Candidatus Omnitrophica bacterium]|nr:hypothetical protein [Candidatus Omnitrophota bacterium]
MANIFFLEKSEDLDILLANREERDLIIALTPEASYELERNGIAHKILEEEYFTCEQLT